MNVSRQSFFLISGLGIENKEGGAGRDSGLQLAACSRNAVPNRQAESGGKKAVCLWLKNGNFSKSWMKWCMFPMCKHMN